MEASDSMYSDLEQYKDLTASQRQRMAKTPRSKNVTSSMVSHRGIESDAYGLDMLESNTKTGTPSRGPAMSVLSKSRSNNNLAQSAIIHGSSQFQSSNRLANALSRQKTKRVVPPKNVREAENFESLPLEFKPLSKNVYNEKDVCEFCPQLLKGLFNNRHHCRMCAKSMCSDCQVKRRLS